MSGWLGWMLLAVVGVAALACGGVAAAVAFGTAPAPKPMASISAPLRDVDYSDLPPLQHDTARDGTALAYRLYPHDGNRVVVLIHGSSGESSGMHALARAIAAAGFAVYVPDLRGHGNDGRLGDIDYAGQLDDDLFDLVQVVRRAHPEAHITLIGHSSGGGFVLRIAEGKYAGLFARFVLLSPALPYREPTMRPNAGGWVRVFVPRLIGLSILDRLGIHAWQHLPVIAFAVSPAAKVRLAPTYSFVMLQNFGPPRDALAHLGRIAAPTALLVGAEDEVFYADRYAPLLHPLKADLAVTVIPGIDHMGMIVQPKALAAVVAALQ